MNLVQRIITTGAEAPCLPTTPEIFTIIGRKVGITGEEAKRRLESGEVIESVNAEYFARKDFQK